MWPKETRSLQSCLLVSIRNYMIAETMGAHPCSKSEFEIVRAKGCIVKAGVYALIEELFVAIDVLGNAQPETKQLRLYISVSIRP